VQHHRRHATGVQFGGELVDVLGPSCHHQAVTATSDRVHYIIDDLRGADPVRHECRDDDRLKDAGRVAEDVVTDRGGSRMNMQFLDKVRRTRDLVSHRSAVHEHDLLTAIRPDRRTDHWWLKLFCSLHYVAAGHALKRRQVGELILVGLERRRISHTPRTIARYGPPARSKIPQVSA